MKTALRLTIIVLLLAVSNLSAATHYVSLGSTNPTPPYTNWATAATDIQDAVIAAAAGDEVVVTNGAYPGGLAVNTPVALRSVNGPHYTAINGAGAHPCVSLTDGSSLTGFTLTNGASADYHYGGGVSCTSTNALLTNCVITGNSTAWTVGGALNCTLYNCTLTGNSGDGAAGSTLYNCLLSGNFGGGVSESTLYNCTLTGNSGDGAGASTLYNCMLSGNSGGGAAGSTLFNCTLSDNSAGDYYGGGGAFACMLYNCIVYFNTASEGPNYDSSSTLNYCCTTPLPPDGTGNIALDPQLASASHLSADSPCRGAGSAAYARGTDIDGEPWGNPPSIGCDEYHPGAVTGPLTVSLTANYTNVTVGYPVNLTALIEGRTTESVWDFGDGDVAINEPYVTHSWTEPGDYLVGLWAFNESHPGGVSTTVTVHVAAQLVYYVAATSAHSQPPYATWGTAAKKIQQAVDEAVLPGALVLVTNGAYPGGLAVTNPVTLVSVNGPQFTVIDGGGAVHCASLTDGASLSGFTLTNGYPIFGDGGGVWCASRNATVTNCVITGNSGGGVSGSTLYNCTLTGNFGDGAGDSTLYNCTLTGNSWGGAYGSTLYNCTLTGNSGDGAAGSTLFNCTLTGNSGGGVSGSTLYNCIVYFNTASGGANYDTSSALNYCCTTPLPTNGVGNIALDPQLASASHLSANSPCRGAGSAAYATGTDIDGEAWGNPPSIGCDEYHAGAVTGPLTVNLVANYTNVAMNYPVNFTAFIEGRTTASSWDFGDGVVVSNKPYASHAWAAPGDYVVVLRAYNESQPSGVSAALTVQIDSPVVYVTATSAGAQPPYTSWNTAATTIQQAVDSPLPGALVVLVTNGTYAGGLTVDKPITVLSVNGPQSTVIDAGGWPQCVSLTDGASLTGFTLTNGSGGVSCTSTNAFLTNCVISGNSGSGANGGTLNNCTLTGNGANDGGGANGGTLYNCTLSGNVANTFTCGDGWTCGGAGGGALNCTLYNCTLIGNSALTGGGAYGCTLYNCTLTGNGANDGGGAYGCTFYNCTLSGNSAQGCWISAAPPGDVIGMGHPMYSPAAGGGVSGSTLYNCIVYFNTATNEANYDSSSTLNYCCTTPLPTNGVGNIALDPQLASASHLSADSPCRGAGNAAYTTGTDIDGDPWNNPPSIGCDEYLPGAVTGPLTVSLVANYNNVAVGCPVALTALIEGQPTDSVWDFGDGDVAINEPYVTHSWTEPGDYLVALWAFNESNLEGMSATGIVHVAVHPVLYVSATSTNPQPPYISWATAATNIQDAVDVAGPGAEIVVTNGVYAGGVGVNTPLALVSVNGPQFTVINGGGPCVSLTDGASLTGFTVTNGYSPYSPFLYSGGGVSCTSTNVFLTNCAVTGNIGSGASGGTLYNCTLTGNSFSDFGGGADQCTLYNCTLSGNSAWDGGGAYGGTLYNCTLTGNSAYGGGGASGSTLYNCIVYDNTTSNGIANYDSSSTLTNCCTTPLPPAGFGNIINDPLFVDYASGNLRLQSNSPCINSGNNPYVRTTTDLDGNPRIVGGTVDIGAYEYQTPTSVISYAWLQRYGLPTDGSADYADTDGNGMNNWQKWIVGLNPTNPASVLAMMPPIVTNPSAGVTVSWQSVAGVNYFLTRSTNLTEPFTLMATNIVGQAGTTGYTDTNAPGAGPLFYRVGVPGP